MEYQVGGGVDVGKGGLNWRGQKLRYHVIAAKRWFLVIEILGSKYHPSEYTFKWTHCVLSGRRYICIGQN